VCTAHHRAVHDGRLRITGEAPALTFAHEDRRPYGAPPPSASGHASETQQALRTLGFSRDEAAAAAIYARAHVGCAAVLEDWIRAALRACPKPRG
jgi:hypothetical protein